MSTLTLHGTGGQHGPVHVVAGPGLLAGLTDGPSLAAHVDRYGPVPRMPAAQLAALVASTDLRGRGGAGFPFARKVAAVTEASGRATVVVNVSEGEPASLKDGVLAQVAPHLVLDGAVIAAHAVRARDVHLVLPGERPEVGLALRRALSERGGRGRRHPGRDGRLRWHLHDAASRFVAGESSAVIELVSGRENLPVTTWQPAAVSGYRGRPTLVSNAETYAQLARLMLLGPSETLRLGTTEEPGTTLLTVDGDRPDASTPIVLEVPFGTPWTAVLPVPRTQVPVLLGGYHGSWAAPGALTTLSVSRAGLGRAGLSLGAGIVLPLDHGCPVERTSRIASYLAGQSAGRCGPCLNGLPSLARAVDAVRLGRGGTAEVERLARLVDGRGACAHPDGTVKLVRSMLTAFPDELATHADGTCTFQTGAAGAAGGTRSWLSEVSA